MRALVAAAAVGIGVGLLVPGTAAGRRLSRSARRGVRAGVRHGSTGGAPGSTTPTRAGPAQRAAPPADPRAGRLAAGLAALCLVGLFGVPWGLGLGALAVAVVPRLLGRLEPASARRRRERIGADLPLAVDLLGACLRAGRPAGDALTVVATAVGGPLGALFAEVDARLRLGADPADAWRLLAAEPACASLARAVRRSMRSGAPLADTLLQLADDVRRERRWSADERARTVEARSVVPLGLCFLPAFVLIGIVPTVAGALSGVFAVFGGSG